MDQPSFTRRLLFSWALYVPVLFSPLSLIEKAVLLSIFCFTPLTLWLTLPENPFQKSASLSAIRFHPLFALMAWIAFLLPQGWPAGILSLCWLGYAFFLAWLGASRLLARGWTWIEECAIDFGHLYYTMGGIWFIFYHFDLPVLHFTETIVLLTSVHFHYSAPLIPVMAGLAGRLLTEQETAGWKYRFIVGGTVGGPLLVAAGITFSRSLEWVAVVIYTCSLFLYLWVLFRLFPKFPIRSRLLFLGSALSLAIGMILAIGYSVGNWLGTPWVTIPDMVSTHGLINAIGFCGMGLMGWLAVHPSQRKVSNPYPISPIRGKTSIGAEFLERLQLIDAERRRIGLVDDFSIYERPDFHPERVAPEIRHFYEHTTDYELSAQITWHRGFRLFSRLYSAISSRIGQLHLPSQDRPHLAMKGEIIPIKPEADSRPDPRAWVRTDAQTGAPLFVALYSYHRTDGETYMNIALPLPFGNMTGILRIDHAEKQGITLSSVRREQGQPGDEGIILFHPWLTVRLPLSEHFHVWTENGRLKAEHRMWLWKWPLLTLKYDIVRKD